MRRTAIIVTAACACQLAVGADAAAAATLPETHHVDIDYAEALNDLEREMGSGPGTDHEHHQPHHHDDLLQKKRGSGPRRERKALDDIAQLDERLRNFEGKVSHDDLREHFHQRQKDKRVQLDQKHREVSERLQDHHEGRKLLSDEELELHEKRKGALERKRRSLEEETPERYLERMERHEEKLREKFARKQKRHDERFGKLKEEL